MRAKVLGETVLDPAADLAEADLGLRGAREAAADVEQLQADPEPLRGEEHGAGRGDGAAEGGGLQAAGTNVETGIVIIYSTLELQRFAKISQSRRMPQLKSPRSPDSNQVHLHPHCHLHQSCRLLRTDTVFVAQVALSPEQNVF